MSEFLKFAFQAEVLRIDQVFHYSIHLKKPLKLQTELEELQLQINVNILRVFVHLCC